MKAREYLIKKGFNSRFIIDGFMAYQMDEFASQKDEELIEIIRLYISDLNNIVPSSPARNNRIAMLEEKLKHLPNNPDKKKDNKKILCPYCENVNVIGNMLLSVDEMKDFLKKRKCRNYSVQKDCECENLREIAVSYLSSFFNN